MLKIFFLMVFGSVMITSKVNAIETKKANVKVSKPKVVRFDHDHKKFDALLKKFVSKGVVDYKKISESANLKMLDAYLVELESVSKKGFEKFSKDEKLAFLINAYNAYTIKLILNYALKSKTYEKIESIKKLERNFLGIYKNSFKFKFIPLKIMGNEKISLDDIEHEYIRKKIVEPLAHFGLVCASKSCPSLLNDAYTGKKVIAQLKESAKKFLADETKNRYKLVKNTFFLSRIFDWFKKDFGGTDDALKKYLQEYLPKKNIKADYKIRYLDYDWSLNGN